jgi:hypothetical protein
MAFGGASDSISHTRCQHLSPAIQPRAMTSRPRRSAVALKSFNFAAIFLHFQKSVFGVDTFKLLLDHENARGKVFQPQNF